MVRDGGRRLDVITACGGVLTGRPGATATEQVLRLLGGKMIAQAVSTAAELGLMDHVATEPKSADELAELLSCNGPMLARLLAVLAGEGVLEEDVDGRFSATDLGLELTHARLGPLAAFIGSPLQWIPWANLRRTIRTGGSAFELAHGTDLYQWLQSHPDDARQYDRSIDRFTHDQARALAEAYDFSSLEHVVDVGGGRGSMLIELMLRWPNLNGTLFDVPHVVESAKARFGDADLLDRCRFEGGDFFDRIPAGGDAYLLKHVLHNWDDPEALKILAAVRSAIPPHGRLLIVEGVMPPGPLNSTARMMDLEMMVLFGRGRERTKLEFKRLMTEAGFRLDGYTAPLGHFARLLTARLRD